MHRAESILDAVTTNLTGLVTTGSQVARGRVWPAPGFPALSIFKGDDLATAEPLDEEERDLSVSVVALVQATGNPETTLNQIAAEVFAALMADRTQGLAYVFDTALVGDEAPEIEDSQDLPIGRMEMIYTIRYEHSKTSAEA